MRGARTTMARLFCFRDRELGQPSGVTRHCVDLEIDEIASLALSPGRDLERVANKQNVEVGAIDSVDGQRCAVKRDRALRRDELGQMLRRTDAETGGIALFGDGEDLGLAIDMAGDDVAAQFVADLQRALEIDRAA